MKIILSCNLLILLLWSSLFSTAQFADRKKGLIQYLDQVTSDSLVLVGQHCGNGNSTEQGYNQYVEGLYQLTGRYPALIGLEYGYSPNNDLSFINSFAVKHSENGGLVTVTWHADNPWQEGYNCRWNSVDNKNTINFKELLKGAPDSEAKSNYRQELMEVGRALQGLRDSGIVVFWRPFHEMNGAWFWWGTDDIESPENTEDYKKLWQDMYTTFKTDLGLNNLIWVYSPMAENDWTSPLLSFYPGDELVDVVGADVYSIKPEFKDYSELAQLGKPVVVGEIGPLKESYGNYDEMQILNQLRGKAAWFLQWSSWTNAKVAIIDNPNAKNMMNHEAIITRDEVKTE